MHSTASFDVFCWRWSCWDNGPSLLFGVGFGTTLFGHNGWGWHRWNFDWHHRSAVFDHTRYDSSSRTFYNRDRFWRGGAARTVDSRFRKNAPAFREASAPPLAAMAGRAARAVFDRVPSAASVIAEKNEPFPRAEAPAAVEAAFRSSSRPSASSCELAYSSILTFITGN